MSTIFQDLRYGVRMLSRTPGFTTVALLTLTLGISSWPAISQRAARRGSIR